MIDKVNGKHINPRLFKETIKNAPCKFCARRKVGCHATCNDYLTWKKTPPQTKERKM